MVDGALIDVCISLVTLYFVLSVICSAIQEGIASLFGLRSTNLANAIQNTAGNKAIDIYQHALIKSFSRQGIMAGGKGKANELPPRKPSYIDAAAFRKVVIDIVDRDTKAVAEVGDKAAESFDKLDAKIEALSDENPLKENLKSAAAAARRRTDDPLQRMAALEEEIEDWFDATMERAAGWYKRRAQYFLLVIAAVVTISLDVDTLRIAKELWSDQKTRQQAVVAAQALQTANSLPAGDADAQVRKDAAEAEQAALQKAIAHLPIGHRCEVVEESSGAIITAFSCISDRAQHGSTWIGWVVSVFAISFGAPFWYGLLSKLIAFRASGVKPPTGSERRKAKQGST